MKQKHAFSWTAARRLVVAVSLAGMIGVPAGQSAQAAAPAKKPVAAHPVAAKPASAILGAWKVTWPSLRKSSSMVLSGETDTPGVARFAAKVTDPLGVACAGSGFAAATIGGVFPLGGDINMVGVSDYMRIASKCGSGQIVIDALAVPGPSVQWIGRATLIDAKGVRHAESFVASR